jgi:ribosomal protein L22
MSEEPDKTSETPDEQTETEAAPAAAAERSPEADAPVEDEATQSASAEDATSSSAADAEPEAAPADAQPEAAAPDEEPEAEAEAPAPKPRRRRRKAAEPAADEAMAEPEAGAETAEPEAGEAEVAAEPETPARSASPSRRRARRDPDLPAPVVRAQAKYVRSSARKARLVCDHIRGKSVEEARAILAVTPRAIARDWSKLLESAVANAEHNHELVGEDLFIKSVHADEGPTIKRFRPRAMGRATRIRKRTSHLTIMLTPKD